MQDLCDMWSRNRSTGSPDFTSLACLVDLHIDFSLARIFCPCFFFRFWVWINIYLANTIHVCIPSKLCFPIIWVTYTSQYSTEASTAIGTYSNTAYFCISFLVLMTFSQLYIYHKLYTTQWHQMPTAREDLVCLFVEYEKAFEKISYQSIFMWHIAWGFSITL